MFLALVAALLITRLDYFDLTPVAKKRARRALMWATVLFGISSFVGAFFTKAESDAAEDRLTARIERIQASLDPFIEAARKRHPSASSDAEALARFRQDLDALAARTQNLEVHATPRTLSPDQHKALVGGLAFRPGSPITVLSVLGDNESKVFAAAIAAAAAATEAGWTVSLQEGVFEKNKVGLLLAFGGAGDPPEPFNVLGDALTAAGNMPTPERHSDLPAGAITLYVGVKPTK